MTICQAGLRNRADHHGRHMAFDMPPPRPSGPSVLKRKSVVASSISHSQWQQQNATSERDSATADQRCFIADSTVPFSRSVPGLITRDGDYLPDWSLRLSTYGSGPMSQARVISTETQREQFNRRVETDTVSRRKRTASQMMAPYRPDDHHQTDHGVRTMALNHLTKPAVRTHTGIPPNPAYQKQCCPGRGGVHPGREIQSRWHCRPMGLHSHPVPPTTEHRPQGNRHPECRTCLQTHPHQT